MQRSTSATDRDIQVAVLSIAISRRILVKEYLLGWLQRGFWHLKRSAIRRMKIFDACLAYAIKCLAA